MADDKPYVLSDDDDRVVTITLNRPERHNSLVPSLLDQLTGAFAALDSRDGDRVGVLRANGRSFSTGGDLAAIAAAGDRRAEYADRLVGALNAAIVAIADCRKPVIVAVDGAVTGGALGLVLAADLVVVTPAASFAPWYARVGLSPDGGWTALLPRVVGLRRAREILLLEQTIDARAAHATGIAQALVQRDELDTQIAAWTARLLGNDGASLTATKRLLDDADWRAGLEREREQFVATVTTPQAIRGVADFVAGNRTR